MSLEGDGGASEDFELDILLARLPIEDKDVDFSHTPFPFAASPTLMIRCTLDIDFCAIMRLTRVDISTKILAFFFSEEYNKHLVHSMPAQGHKSPQASTITFDQPEHPPRIQGSTSGAGGDWRVPSRIRCLTSFGQAIGKLRADNILSIV